VTAGWGSNHGTAVGTPDLKDGTSCITGKCLSFNGSTDYVDCGNLGIPINGPATISGWFYFRDLTTDQGLYSILFRGNWGSTYVTHNSTYFPGVVFVVNTWYNIALTYSGDTSTAKLIVNSTSYNANTQGAPNAIVALTDFHIGRESSFFNGLIDDVRIYNSVIPTSQIQQNYFAGLNKLFAKRVIKISEYQNRLTELKLNYAKD
jgi:hypothetical protein